MLLPLDPDVLVIGAGPAGTASAALLQRAGHRVAIVERDVFPRFQIGESLLPRSMETLEEAGLLEAVAARGYLVKRGATFLRGEDRCVFDFAEAHHHGWTWTWQVPRADFDNTLAQACEARGIPIAWRHEVVDVELPPSGYRPDVDGPRPAVTVRDADGVHHVVRPRWVVDASGYGRVLPRLLGLDRPSGQPIRRAIFAHVDGDERPPGIEGGRIWVTLHPKGAWIWIIPFADGTTSVGVVAPESFWAERPADLGEAWAGALREDPNAQLRLANAVPRWAPRELRGYSATVSSVHGPGFHLVGNATEFLDPVFSSGVTLAFESARVSARLLDRALRGGSVDWESDYARVLASGVDVFRTYVDTWYDGSLPTIFFAKDTSGPIKGQICSVLAGYVWDESNPFVRLHERRVRQTVRLVQRAEATAG